MIHHVDGTIAAKEAGRVVVEVGGVGLELLVPDATERALPSPGGRVQLLTHLVVREDAWTLFGFESERERALFRMLLAVQGVGPKLALAILSSLSPDRLCRAVGDGDVAALSTVVGVGKKTAQRLIVDLRDKVGPPLGLVAGAASVTHGAEPPDDAVDALVALGYPRTRAYDAVQRARTGESDRPSEEIVKLALRKL